MSKEKIKKIAIKHFNQYGYEGTKMAQIAEEAGMRKQSLSYHYPSKKELLLEVYTDVIKEEQMFVRDYFDSTQELSLENQLYTFLNEHKNRFLTNPNVALLYNLSFITPLEVYDYILAQFRLYLGTFKEVVADCFAKQELRLSPEECTIAFVTLVDGLDIQLVYESTQTYEKVQQVAWDIFWNGIQV